MNSRDFGVILLLGPRCLRLSCLENGGGTRRMMKNEVVKKKVVSLLQITALQSKCIVCHLFVSFRLYFWDCKACGL